jgi:uncharacterized protein
MHVWKRRLAKYARWLHIYTSMTSFVIVFFFAVTGWTLNHPDRFSGRERITRAAGGVDAHWTNTGAAPVAKVDIVDAIRRAQHVSGAVSDFRTDDDQVSITFKGPGYSADASVDRRTGKYDVTESRLGLVAIANDLHKGRDAGTVWKAVIDVSAGLLTFVSLTGLVLIYYIHKHRLAGVILLAVGGLLAAMLYAFVVP